MSGAAAEGVPGHGGGGGVEVEEGDPFEAVLQLEETLVQLGRQNGRLNADQAAFAEGRQLGLSKGAEIGRELGFYAGHLLAWQTASHHHLPSSSSSSSSSPAPSARTDAAEAADSSPASSGVARGGGARAEEVMARLWELLAAFPADPTREDLFDQLDRIRGKYRQAASLLKAPASARYPPAAASAAVAGGSGASMEMPTASQQRLAF